VKARTSLFLNLTIKIIDLILKSSQKILTARKRKKDDVQKSLIPQEFLIHRLPHKGYPVSGFD